MNKTVNEINKLMVLDVPMNEINEATGCIDITSCFDPIFMPPIDFLEECRKRQEAAQLRSVLPLNGSSAAPGISLKLNALEMSRLPTR